MKTMQEYTEEIPTWALSYIHNNDASGLDEGEIKMVDDFTAWFYEQAKLIGGHVIFGYNNDDEGGFTPVPAFGLACDCVNTEILICI